jgi:hypothetical protein
MTSGRRHTSHAYLLRGLLPTSDLRTLLHTWTSLIPGIQTIPNPSQKSQKSLESHQFSSPRK